MAMSKPFAAMPADRKTIRQSKLNISQRVRTNSFPWTGQFSPQLVEELLAAYAPKDGLLLDPFAGSGTCLVEGARFGLSACGVEINPAAVILARVYRMVNLSVIERSEVVACMDERLSALFGPLFAPSFCGGLKGTDERKAIESELVRVWRESPDGPARDLAAALVVLCDFFRKKLDASDALKSWAQLKRVVAGLPESPEPVAIHHADARNLPVESDSVDIVITSPPYINVHNYHQKFRRSVEALGWNVLDIAPSEIGSNRQNRGNRFLTVIQYSLDMALALLEMARAVKNDGRLIVVIGRESSVQGIRFMNSALVAELAVEALGLSIERRQERVFQNRYGVRIYEDIAHIRNGDRLPAKSAAMDAARRIARKTLLATAESVPLKEQAMISHAVERADAAAPSRMANLGELE